MSKKIKVLHILPNLSRAGAEKVCFDIVSNLDRERFSPSLLLFKDNGEGMDWQDSLREKSIPIYSLNKKYKLDIRNIWQIYKTIRQQRPDIVHTHLGADVYGRIAAYLAGIKIIVSTEHNINVSERPIITWLKKVTARMSVKIFPVSQAVKSDAITRYNIDSERLIVIYNGIDLDYFNNKNIAPKVNRDKIIIGAMGRLSKQKGFHLLIEAAEKIKHKDFKILIAGEGELKSELRDQINILNLADKVELLGLVDSKEFLQKIDIFVFPSLWEGLGLVALEAAAMGKPIVASATGGIAEIISQESGYLFEVGDENDLARQLNILISGLGSEELTSKVERARELVAQRFTLDKMIFDYSVWYEKLYNK